MSDLVFKISQNVVLGSFTVNRLAEYTKEYGSRFIIVMDPKLKDSDSCKQIMQSLDEHECKYFIYDNTEDGANTKNIEYALKLAREARVEAVIALGITQTLLLGAAVASIFSDERTIYDILDEGKPMETPALPLLCVPTTIRVPYIFTQYLPLIDSRTRKPRLLRTQNALCKLVLWDSEMTALLPDNKRVSTCIETLSLATEAYISQKATFFSDMFALESVKLLNYAMNGCDTLQVTTPKNLLLTQGGFLASLATATSSVGVASLLSMVLNSHYGVSLSTVASILLPHIIEDAIQYKADRIKKISSIMGIKDGSHEGLISDVKQRLEEEKIPTKLQDLDLSVDKLAMAAEDCGGLDLINTLPRSMTTDDLFNILKKAY